MSADASSAVWMSSGKCRGYPNYQLWFSDSAEDVQNAKNICAGCPVRTECLDFAVANHESHGVWGGLSEQERRADPRRSTVRRHGSNIIFPGRRTHS